MMPLLACIGPVYRFHVAINEREFLDLAAKLDPSYKAPWLSNGACATSHFLYPNGPEGIVHSIVCLAPKLGSGAELIGSIVHEAAHVMQTTLKYYGMSPCDETMAYALQNIARAMIDAMIQRKVLRIAT
jgi:hypothetical protein